MTEHADSARGTGTDGWNGGVRGAFTYIKTSS